jgi:hypothetical protein
MPQLVARSERRVPSDIRTVISVVPRRRHARDPEMRTLASGKDVTTLSDAVATTFLTDLSATRHGMTPFVRKRKNWPSSVRRQEALVTNFPRTGWPRMTWDRESGTGAGAAKAACRLQCPWH